MRGWAFVGNSRKAHYFIIPEGKTGGMSLCNGWMLLGASQDYLEDEAHFSSDNCKKCNRMLVRDHPEIIEKDKEEYGKSTYDGSVTKEIEK